jgi:hypothetical protein
LTEIQCGVVPPARGVELVTVFASGNWVEADMVACALEGHQIPTLILDDNVCRILPEAVLLIGGIKVIVRVEDLSDAADLLQLRYKGGPPFIGGFLTMPLSLPAALFAWLRGLWRRGSRQDDNSSSQGYSAGDDDSDTAQSRGEE